MSNSRSEVFSANLRRAIGTRSLKDLSQSLSPGGYDWLRRIVSRGLDRISEARRGDLTELCRELGVEPHQLWNDPAAVPAWQRAVTVADLLQLGAERLSEVTGVPRLQILELACLNSATSVPVNKVFSEAYQEHLRADRLAKIRPERDVEELVEEIIPTVEPEEPDVDPNDLDALLDAGIDPLTMQTKNPR